MLPTVLRLHETRKEQHSSNILLTHLGGNIGSFPHFTQNASMYILAWGKKKRIYISNLALMSLNLCFSNRLNIE